MTVDCRELIAALDSYLMMDGRDETPMAERVARLMEARRKCIEALNAEPPDNRDPECVKQWPDCHDGGYDPRCCRFPKSCSCGGQPKAKP